jgi:hypothetical protein
MFYLFANVLDSWDIVFSDPEVPNDFLALQSLYLNNHPVALNKTQMKTARISESID